MSLRENRFVIPEVREGNSVKHLVNLCPLVSPEFGAPNWFDPEEHSFTEPSLPQTVCDEAAES